MCQATGCKNCKYRVKRGVPASVAKVPTIPLPPTSGIHAVGEPPSGANWLCQLALEEQQPNVLCVHPDCGTEDCPLVTGKGD